MRGTKIAGTISYGVTLTLPDQDPLVILATGAILPPIYPDIDASAPGPWIIANFGTLALQDTVGIGWNDDDPVPAVEISGGTLTNGSITDLGATIIGSRIGIEATGAGPFKLENLGTIYAGNGGPGGDATAGVAVEADLGTNTIINGSLQDTMAFIGGAVEGIEVGGTALVLNYGKIEGGGRFTVGISLGAGSATVVNGAETDTTAFIGGIYAGPGSHPIIVNFGHINDAGYGDSIDIFSDGNLTNGSATDTSAMIGLNSTGVYVAPPQTGVLPTVHITNFGTIFGGVGIDMDANGWLINAGTIEGLGDAVVLRGGAERLIVDPGGSFFGDVVAVQNTNTMELAPGVGTISGLGTQFTGFAAVDVDAGGDWTLTNTLFSTDNSVKLLVNLGTITVDAGTTFSVTGSLLGTGTIDLGGDTVATIQASAVSSTRIVFLSDDTLVIGDAAAFGTGIGTSGFAGPQLQGFAQGDMIDLPNIARSEVTGLSYDPASGALAVLAGSQTVAELKFQTASLGAGHFQLGADTNSTPGTLLFLS